jgi:hypothetical protein
LAGCHAAKLWSLINKSFVQSSRYPLAVCKLHTEMEKTMTRATACSQICQATSNDVLTPAWQTSGRSLFMLPPVAMFRLSLLSNPDQKWRSKHRCLCSWATPRAGW